MTAPITTAALVLAALTAWAGACLAADSPPLYTPQGAKPRPPATYKPQVHRPAKSISTYKPSAQRPSSTAKTYKPPARQPSQARKDPPQYRPSGPTYRAVR